MPEKGIETVFDLAKCDANQIRREFGLPLSQTVKELRGESCIELGDSYHGRKQILRSRSFNSPVISKEDLLGAIPFHATECAQTMRLERSFGSIVGIILDTNRFRETDPQYHAYPSAGLPYPVSDTPTIVRCASHLLDRYFKPGYCYKRADVYVSALNPETQHTMDLFYEDRSRKDKLLCCTIDAANCRFGKNKVCFDASILGQESWQLKRSLLSPHYTTCWSEIVKIGALKREMVA